MELRSVDSIDILDSLCSSIRIDLKGLEVVRILPRKNELVNEDWITDVARYSFDGLSKQRLSFPLLYNLVTSSFIKKSWAHFFNSFLSSYLSLSHFFDYSSSLLAIGSTIDLYSMYVLSLLSQRINRPIYDSSISHYFVDKTFRSTYLIGHDGLKKIEQHTSFLLFQLDLDNAFPLVSTRIRKALQSNTNIQVLYIGKNRSSLDDLTHLGLSTNSAIRLLRGKQVYSYSLLSQQTSFLSTFNNSFSALINIFNQSVPYSSISYSSMLSRVSDIHLCELGISNNINFVTEKIIPTFIYALDSSTFSYNYSDIPFFYISQSTHASLHQSIKRELLTIDQTIWHLPVCSSFEESSPYMNLLGLIQWTKKALDRYGFSQTHNYIIFNLLILLNGDSNELQTHILYAFFIERTPQIQSSVGCFFSFNSSSVRETTYFLKPQKQLPIYADYSLTLQRINSFKLNRINEC